MNSKKSKLINLQKSIEIMEKAEKLIPGGVNSPVRAYPNMSMKPPVIAKAQGSNIYDVDGNEYIDYIGSWGPMILGHNDITVTGCISIMLEYGTSYGAPTQIELELAEKIVAAVPSIEMVRMTSSGTEAVMSAIRVARGYTNRDDILKFVGCYHGHSDSMLVKAGSGAMTTGVPDSAGVPADFAKHTITADYNNCEMLEKIFNTMGDKLAAVIIEPIAGNMGVVAPNIEFLKLLRNLTHKYGTVLIFDEVISGFRVSYGGAQELYGIIPDMTTLGKIIGGGMPVGAFGGRRDIMNKVSPVGNVYQAGTLSGNPLAMGAGITTLNILRNNKIIYEDLEQKGKQLEIAYTSLAKKHNIDLTVNRVGSLMTPFFTNQKVTDYNSAITSNTDMFCMYFKEMIQRNIYIAPSQYESMFLSCAITQEQINTTIKSIDEVFNLLSKK